MDALRFDPRNTGGSLQPAGFFNRVRDFAYPASQAAWGRARSDGRRRQLAADRVLRELLAAPPP